MKQKLLVGLIGLVLAPTAWAQPSDVWENWGQIVVPSTNFPYAPQIDAITFINHRGALLSISGSALFNTSDTLYYTNQGVMSGFPGFDLQTYPSSLGAPHMAANFANLASGPGGGVINANGTFLFTIAGAFTTFGNLAGNAQLRVLATNIVNSGEVNMTAGSLVKFEGKNVDLSRGGLTMASASGLVLFGTNIIGINSLFNSGILDGYWAAEQATNAFNPAANFTGTFPFTQPHWVTNRNYFMLMTELFGVTPYVNIIDNSTRNSNRLFQAVFIENIDPSFVNTVYFTPFEIAVQWQWNTPAWPSSTITTNYLYLTDNFGEVTNLAVALDGFVNPQAFYPTPTYKPINYQFVQGLPYTLAPPATPGLLPNFFPNGAFTNQYTGYEALFTAGTALITDVAGGAFSNMPGRIEISSETLDVNHSRISSLNYVRLEATNHFKGSQNAAIITPYADYNLRVTNGLLTISNVIAPFVNHPNGPCDLYSCRWTNVVNSITNSFHVLFVDSFMSPLTLPQVGNLKLVVTNSPGAAPKNLVINDVLNVTTSLQLAAERLTIGQNDQTAFAPAGQLNLLSGDIIWPTATPGLQYLTNWGVISSQNAIFFGGSRTQPPYNTNTVNIPYQAFANYGTISNQGSIMWANYFENDGTFEAGQGSIVLQNCSYALLNGGLFDASQGLVSIGAGTLVSSNHTIVSGGSLDLYLTNSVNDGGPPLVLGTNVFGGNQWSAEGGFSLYIKPATGDLLGTIVASDAPDFAETLNYWAGEDRGNSTAGFSNNCAVGKLLLSGGTNSSFHFIGTGAANGIYVDYLGLSDSLTNRDIYGNIVGLNIDPNIKIYYAEAVMNGHSVAEKLNGKNGGHLVWVSSYAGAFSSTNLLYPDGRTYTFNRALVQSCDIDSDGDGIVNCNDPTPIYVPGIVQLSISLVTQPQPAKLLSWQTIANSTNLLYYKSSPASTNWLLLTNFVFGPNNGTARVLDPSSSATRFYRVTVQPR